MTRDDDSAWDAAGADCAAGASVDVDSDVEGVDGAGLVSTGAALAAATAPDVSAVAAPDATVAAAATASDVTVDGRSDAA